MKITNTSLSVRVLGNKPRKTLDTHNEAKNANAPPHDGIFEEKKLVDAKKKKKCGTLVDRHEQREKHNKISLLTLHIVEMAAFRT